MAPTDHHDDLLARSACGVVGPAETPTGCPGDQNSILSWQGSTVSPDICGGFPMDNVKGAVFTATVSQNPPTGSLVGVRFKYRDPAAAGGPNTDCTSAGEPNRNRADVCGASWSQPRFRRTARGTLLVPASCVNRTACVCPVLVMLQPTIWP
jgi:hypothetical protein